MSKVYLNAPLLHSTIITCVIALVFLTSCSSAIVSDIPTTQKLELVYPTRENTTPNNIEIIATVSGKIINGSDITPEGLLDSPRKFVYKIKIDDGLFIDVAYTSYPPSPVGDRKRNKIRLSFHKGTIRIGDYLKARGTYNKKTNVLTVAKEGDYIETYDRTKAQK